MQVSELSAKLDVSNLAVKYKGGSLEARLPLTRGPRDFTALECKTAKEGDCDRDKLVTKTILLILFGRKLGYKFCSFFALSCDQED